MIASFIPGRIRIRNPKFKDPDLASTAEALLREHPCVIKVTANSTTGGLLIEYDPAKLDIEAAQQALEQIDPEGLEWFKARNEAAGEALGGSPARIGAASQANKEALEYLAMIGVFVICMGSAFLRSKGLHVYSGLSLAGMTVSHIIKYRDKLMRHFQNLRKS